MTEVNVPQHLPPVHFPLTYGHDLRGFTFTKGKALPLNRFLFLLNLSEKKLIGLVQPLQILFKVEVQVVEMLFCGF